MPTSNTNSSAKVALVTGGARRIGRAICEALHQAGFKVLVHCHRSTAEAQTLVNTFNSERANSAALLQADLTDLQALKALANRAGEYFGRLDVLINNASSFYPTPVANARETQWDDLLGSNLKAPFFLAQALYPRLAKHQGCIINMVDIYAEKPMPGHGIYSIAKAGNCMMVMALAQEFAPAVRVNGIAPGAILWPEDSNGKTCDNPDKLRAIPMQSLGGTAPIAQAVLFLIDQAPYTTGQILTVDGGKSLNL